MIRSVHSNIKTTFQQAKDAAFEALDSCPAEVKRRLINRSWRQHIA